MSNVASGFPGFFPGSQQLSNVSTQGIAGTGAQQSALGLAALSASGQMPSAADYQMRAGLQQAQAAAGAQAASTRGSFGLAGAQKAAQATQAGLAQQNVNAMAAQRAAEQQAAISQYGNMAGQQRQQDLSGDQLSLSQASTQAQMAQAQQNANQGTGMNLISAGIGAGMKALPAIAAFADMPIGGQQPSIANANMSGTAGGNPMQPVGGGGWRGPTGPTGGGGSQYGDATLGAPRDRNISTPDPLKRPDVAARRQQLQQQLHDLDVYESQQHPQLPAPQVNAYHDANLTEAPRSGRGLAATSAVMDHDTDEGYVAHPGDPSMAARDPAKVPQAGPPGVREPVVASRGGFAERVPPHPGATDPIVYDYVNPNPNTTRDWQERPFRPESGAPIRFADISPEESRALGASQAGAPPPGQYHDMPVATSVLSEPSGGPPGQGAEWTLREERKGPGHKSFIAAVDHQDHEVGKVRIDPLTPSEQKQVAEPHGAGPLPGLHGDMAMGAGAMAPAMKHRYGDAKIAGADAPQASNIGGARDSLAAAQPFFDAGTVFANRMVGKEDGVDEHASGASNQAPPAQPVQEDPLLKARSATAPSGRDYDDAWADYFRRTGRGMTPEIYAREYPSGRVTKPFVSSSEPINLGRGPTTAFYHDAPVGGAAKALTDAGSTFASRMVGKADDDHNSIGNVTPYQNADGTWTKDGSPNEDAPAPGSALARMATEPKPGQEWLHGFTPTDNEFDHATAGQIANMSSSQLRDATAPGGYAGGYTPNRGSLTYNGPSDRSEPSDAAEGPVGWKAPSNLTNPPNEPAGYKPGGLASLNYGPPTSDPKYGPKWESPDLVAAAKQHGIAGQAFGKDTSGSDVALIGTPYEGFRGGTGGGTPESVYNKYAKPVDTTPSSDDSFLYHDETIGGAFDAAQKRVDAARENYRASQVASRQAAADKPLLKPHAGAEPSVSYHTSPGSSRALESLVGPSGAPTVHQGNPNRLTDPAFSDERAKQLEGQHTGFAAASDFMRTLQPHAFTWKDPSVAPNPSAAAGKNVGVFAQEVARTPYGKSIVQRDPGTGYLTMDKNALVGALAASAGALKQQQDDHALRIQELERALGTRR